MADKDGIQDWLNEPTEDPTSGFSPDRADEAGDEFLKQHLADYSPESTVHGWEKLEASLDAADEAFDRTVQHKLRQYHPPYDPHAWSHFARKFSFQRHLRSRLILLKISEAIAVILVLFTALHLKELNQLPAGSEMAALKTTDTDFPLPAATQNQVKDAVISGVQQKQDIISNASISTAEITNSTIASSAPKETADIVISESLLSNEDLNPTAPIPAEESALDHIYEYTQSSSADGSETADVVEETNHNTAGTVDFLTGSINTLDIPVGDISIASTEPILRAPRKSKYFEFGMLVQGDYNQLKMPGDKVNTNARQFTFPLQGLTSPGYGAGLTLAISYPRWAIETGAIYNAKKFSPDREVIVQDAFATSNVELEKMLMQFVSIPLQVRYKFDARGRVRTYAQAGFGLHMIMQSHADVDVEYDFPTLVEGEDPNADPALRRTIRQTQLASEDLRDQAPFSTNSLVSANLGLGVEYDLFEDKTIFIQSIYQYQIPNLRFQSHQDKHLVTLSIQAGVRTPISR